MCFFISFSNVIAVVSYGNANGNTNLPTGDMGWSYVGSENGASGVYLGGSNGTGWVLTANHVGFGNFTVNGVTYNAIAGSGQQIASIDLYAFKITVGSGTGLSLLSNLTLASTSPTNGQALTIIGNGLDTTSAQKTWYVNTTNPTNYIWSTNYTFGTALAQGYQELGSNGKNWASNVSVGITTSYNSTSMIETIFNNNSSQAGQLAVGDSGGGMFISTGAGFALAGINDLQLLYNNQPANTAIFGAGSLDINIAAYKNQIYAVTGLSPVPEPSSLPLAVLGFAMIMALFRPRKSS